MLEMLLSYLGIANSDTESQNIISMLITLASDAFEDYTGQSAEDHQSIIMRMVIEDWNKVGSEGRPSFSFGTNSESLLTDYSDSLKKQIRRVKKVKVL